MIRIQPDSRFDQAGFLRAFDLNRDLIHAAAKKGYGRGKKGAYDLIYPLTPVKITVDAAITKLLGSGSSL